ncbi:MAG: hypothetical protein ACOX2E_03455 [Syntrophaceticus sp.]|jgi:Zn ribbon nucleic-acid-binding protein
MAVTVIQPPKDYRWRKSRAWCPYCGKETTFGWDKKVDATRCMDCGISSREFHVRVLNGMGKDRELERFERAAKKSKARYKGGE